MLQPARLFIAALLFLLALNGGVLAQTTSERASVTIISSPQTFRRKADARIKVKVVNGLGTTLRLIGPFALRINLSRTRPFSDCRASYCFGAGFPLRHGRNIKPGESLELWVNLADLHWYDRMLAVTNLRKPKNFSDELPAGSYHLSVALVVPNKHKMKETVRSNEILVTVNMAGPTKP